MNIIGFIGKKNDQTQGFLEDGRRIPITIVSSLGNKVLQIKTLEKDGYNAIQIGFGTKKKANKALGGHSKKAGLKETPRFFREIKLADAPEIELGVEINISEILEPGDMVNVTGISKGKGFAGGVKRYHFKGGPRTHGQSDRERAPGSIGQTTTPGRVYKGKKMAGRMGNEQVTVKNLEVIEIKEDGTILLKGLVPGVKNSLIIVKKIGKNNNFIPLYKEVLEEEKVVEKIEEEKEEAPKSPSLEESIKEEKTEGEEKKEEEVKEEIKEENA
ncbi:MAG TPA: 50S ribosomal protein L3 [Patescibacteria group bacterium]|nr:50S ribosomal protein L3 [Patescibacteria group bacterium]